MKQKLQNAFAGGKNIVVLRGRREETLATDILQEGKNYPTGKIHWYQAPKFHILQRNCKVLRDSPRSAGCALLTMVSLDHEIGRYVGCLH